MIALIFSIFCNLLIATAVISENVVIACITATVAVISGPIITVIMFVLKDRADRAERAEMRADAKKAREEIKAQIAENTALTSEVKLAAQVAYTEANNVNLKLASIGIQTKPTPES